MIDQKRWHTMSFAKQMGNIASELSRAERFQDDCEVKHLHSSLERAIELVDLTVSDPRNLGNRLKELCRFKEVLADWYSCSNVYSVKPSSLKNYAMQFVFLQ